jgi:hypothetical protein
MIPVCKFMLWEGDVFILPPDEGAYASYTLSLVVIADHRTTLTLSS